MNARCNIPPYDSNSGQTVQMQLANAASQIWAVILLEQFDGH